MLKFVRLLPFLCCFFLTGSVLQAQDCQLRISGVVQTEHDDDPIFLANILVQETGVGAISDSLGRFQLNNLCPGSYHLVFSHIGCEPIRQFLTVYNDTTIVVFLDHNSHLLDEISITGRAIQQDDHQFQSIDAQKISKNPDASFGQMAKEMVGVHALQTGANVAKPMIHGQTGNRVVILNNGLRQGGQQWGQDHAPEVDLFSGGQVNLITGIRTLEYTSSGLANVLDVQTTPIPNEPHLHGRAGAFYQTNGRGYGNHLSIHKKGAWASWRFSGNFKNMGDRKTAHYFLRNSGNREQNAVFEIQKNGDKHLSHFYMSTFNSELGILRGSHVGNLTDLESAISQNQPFGTLSYFSRDIDAPRQTVSHHLMRLKGKYYGSSKVVWEYFVGNQWDYRKEFDVRRSGRSEDPALSLKQLSQELRASADITLQRQWKLKTGVHWVRTQNENVPETNILPLIPNFNSFQNAAFFWLTKTHEKWNFSWGNRLQHLNRKTLAISTSVPREIISYNRNFQSWTSLLDAKAQVSKNTALEISAGITNRPPAINELYSNGLHQGVSGIELGNPNLKSEFLQQISGSVETGISEVLKVRAHAYIQSYTGYIFLQPTGENQLTIRGAFPVFEYRQNDARIQGLDFTTSYNPTDALQFQWKYSVIQGLNLSTQERLVEIPSGELQSTVAYEWGKQSGWEKLRLEVNHQFVQRQKGLNPTQYIRKPPSDFSVFGFKASADFRTPIGQLSAFIQIQNAFNLEYRNYLNRHYIFAHELGRQVLVGLNVEF